VHEPEHKCNEYHARYKNEQNNEDQFVNIVKNHESTQPNMNSIIKSAAKTIRELSQLNGKSDANLMKYNTRRQDWERF
jgi:hypothetical protein